MFIQKLRSTFKAAVTLDFSRFVWISFAELHWWLLFPLNYDVLILILKILNVLGCAFDASWPRFYYVEAQLGENLHFIRVLFHRFLQVLHVVFQGFDAVVMVFAGTGVDHFAILTFELYVVTSF